MVPLSEPEAARSESAASRPVATSCSEQMMAMPVHWAFIRYLTEENTMRSHVGLMPAPHDRNAAGSADTQREAMSWRV